MTCMTQLTRREILQAFDRSGYSEVEFVSHKFFSTSVRSNGNVCSCYDIKFRNEDTGELDHGRLYIERRADGLLYGEF